MPASDEIRWNLTLKRGLYDRLKALDAETGVPMSCQARLALVQFLNSIEPEKLTLEWVREQLKIVERALENRKKKP